MSTQNLILGADEISATLAWLVEALEHVRSRGQTTVVGYLEEVADDVVFEMEAAARKSSYL